ncbi:MAG: type II secretion system protein J [Candidatus Binatia bacterium]
MPPKRSIQELPVPSTLSGFTLIELLVTLLITSVMMTATTTYFQSVVAARHNTSLTSEADQGLRSLLQMVTQELRQAGACLTQLGQFITLEGVDDGTMDSLTLRIGRTHPDTGRCIQPAIPAGSSIDAGETSFPVADASGFQPGNLVYITPDSVNGDFYRVVDVSGTTLTIDRPLVDFTGGLNPSYEGAGVYPVDERTYAIDTSDSDHPVLTVSIDGGAPQVLVVGVTVFNVRYVLGPCNPACSGGTVDLPAGGGEWRLVRDVEIKAEVKSYHKDKNGDYQYARTGLAGESGEYVSMKPRNLL